jgi:peptidoglycan LD-endopeptidase LytH
MKTRSSGYSWAAVAAAGGFLAGAITMAVLLWVLPNAPRLATRIDQSPAERPLTDAPKQQPSLGDDAGGHRVFDSRPSSLASPPPIARPPIPSSPAPPIIEADPLAELRGRQLALPVRGAIRRDLRDSFYETRRSTQSHEAIDIMAPRNTLVLAVEDGTIARLFESKAGGTTVYQFDPTTRYVYYYAHLERYADGLEEGQHVQRGQLLGYVGSSGNAPKDTPHLHFAIFQLTEKKQWWQGSPIDPFEVLR